VIGTIGTCMVVVMVVSTDGITDQLGRCTFKMKTIVLIPLFSIDAFVCFGGTYMFIRPLKETLSHIEDESIASVLQRTMTWSLFCLGATLMTMLIIGVTDGLGVFVSFDCSVTSFSLVMMLAPAEFLRDSSKLDPNLENANVEIEDLTNVFKKSESGYELANDILDSHCEEVSD